MKPVCVAIELIATAISRPHIIEEYDARLVLVASFGGIDTLDSRFVIGTGDQAVQRVSANDCDPATAEQLNKLMVFH